MKNFLRNKTSLLHLSANVYKIILRLTFRCNKKIWYNFQKIVRRIFIWNHLGLGAVRPL